MSGDEIQCHKIILASRSDFFLDMFDHIDEDSNNKHLVIEDASTKDLKAMIDFMYTDHVTKENGSISLWTLADKFLVEDLKLKCLEFIIDSIDLINANEIIDFFDASRSRHLLTGEMSWNFSIHVKLTVENCIEKFLIGHFHDLAVLKINALYFIQDNWKEIRRSDRFQQMKKVYPEAMDVIEQFTGINDLEDPVTIPFKITLPKGSKPIGFKISFNGGWKYPMITDLLGYYPIANHGRVREGSLILSIGNTSLQYLEIWQIIATFDDLKKNEAEFVTFEIGALDKTTIRKDQQGLYLSNFT